MLEIVIAIDNEDYGTVRKVVEDDDFQEAKLL